MNKLFKILAALPILLFLLSATCKIASDPSSGVPTMAVSLGALDNLVEQDMILQNVRGAAVGLVENGVITHVRTYGHRNADRTLPLTQSSIFRYASVSKTLTAVAVWKAITDGQIGISDLASDHLSTSDWPTDGGKGAVSVLHLLSHRAGIVDYDGALRGSDNEICNTKKRSSNDMTSFNAPKSLERFKHCPLGFSPGTSNAYANYGYDLLGAILESATGQDYVSYVKEHIGDVVGMPTLQVRDNHIGGYEQNCDLFPEFNQSDGLAIKVPAGGWCSNIADMTAYLKGLIEQEYVENMQRMWLPVPFVEQNNKYVYGVRRDSLGNVSPYVTHGGSGGDMRTHLGFIPGDKNGVCIFMNSGDASPSRLANKIFGLMGYGNFGGTFPRNKPDGDSTCGQRVTGIWRLNNNGRDIVLRRGLTEMQLEAEAEYLSSKGWALIDMETYKKNNARKWDGIFKKGARETEIVLKKSTNDFADRRTEQHQAGKHLIDLEVHQNSSSSLRWSGVFQTNLGTQNELLNRNYSKNAFDDLIDERAANWKLIDVEMHKNSVGANRWSGIWHPGTGSRFISDLKQDAFIALCQSLNASGDRLVDVEIYGSGNSRKYAGVWEASTVEERRRFNPKFGFLITARHNPLIGQGFELLDLEVH